jgi:heme exporter protein D
MVSQAEVDMMNSQIREFFAIGSQGFLSQDQYFFTGHTMDVSFIWSLRQKKAWLTLVDNDFKARQARFG